MAKRIKEAGFPYEKYLKDFDLTFCKSLSKKQFMQLSELTWIDGLYNLILSGPPGVGKTHLAIGLGYHACEEGYKVSYTTMQSLVQCLRTEEIDRRSRCKMNRIRKSNLLVIDEVGYLPINSTEGNLFFQLISELQEQRALREWVKDGNSVYENPSEAWSDGQLPVEFLTVYRDEEYIRQHTKGMNPEEARRFAIAYYGWDDEPTELVMQDASEVPVWLREMAIPEELPFN